MADEEPGAAQDFAALMNKAHSQAAGPPGEAEPRYGWTTDPETGERRPKKAAGRPRKPRSLDELKAAKAEQAAQASPEDQRAALASGDRAPDPKARPGKAAAAAAEPVPQHRPGVITRGMNKRYRQLGKLIRPLDGDTGRALIGMSENTSEEPDEDTSVGACWDEVARGNPRIRRFCLAVIQGGAYGALVMAHAPLGVAIALKFVSADPGFFGKLVLSWAEPDPDTPEGEGGLPFGLTAEDAQQMMKMAGPLLEQMGAAVPADGPPPKQPAPFAHNGAGSRRQPRNTSRAARKAG